MDASLDRHRLEIRSHQDRIAETAPPRRARTVADPRWRRVLAAVGHATRRVGRAARDALVVPGAKPVPSGTPALLGRHPCPDAPPR